MNKMDILVLADIHNDIENIMSYLDKVSQIHFDVIVCMGDFSDVGLRGFTASDIVKIVIAELKAFKKPILAVPGNFDKEVLPVLEKEGVSIHGKGKIIDGVGFYGFGGAKTPFKTPLEPSEEELRTGLQKAYDEVKDAKVKVQVTHNPPARTAIDMVYTGAHVGSEVVRKFIEEKKPLVAVSSHIHEARGVDDLGSTKLVNPGRFPEGHCGIVSINNNVVTAKIVSLL